MNGLLMSYLRIVICCSITIFAGVAHGYYCNDGTQIIYSATPCKPYKSQQKAPTASPLPQASDPEDQAEFERLSSMARKNQERIEQEKRDAQKALSEQCKKYLYSNLIGMPESEIELFASCRRWYGKPKISTTETPYGTSRIYLYGSNRSIIFVGGKLRSIHD